MGAWGTDVLDNDVAQDVRAEFEQAIAATGSTAAAISAVRQQFEEYLDDQDDYPEVVLSLAWLASARGDIPAPIRDEAIKVIREGLGSRKWADTPDYEERRAVEQRFQDVLDGRAPHPELRQR